MSYSFLVIGKTQESTEANGGFKRYIGLASTKVLAVNPNKKKLDELMGFESANEPEYVVDGENGKEVRINFIVRTDADSNNGIEVTNRASFILRNTPAYNRDQTKVQVIDSYGNHCFVDVQTAKEGKKLFSSSGQPLKIDDRYRMACVGECDLVDFLKAYLCVQDVFNYVNSSWVKKENAQDYVFGLEHIKDYFSGNFSELNEALALQPNNKVKLLWGVRSSEGKQYQAICTKGDMILRNSAGTNAESKLAQTLADYKARGSFSTIDYKVCPLQEYAVEPTNLETPAEEPFGASELPWD